MAARAPRQALLLIAASLAFVTTAYAQAIQDGRCYLMNGGAVESFFIGEDTPVGSVIGTLSVNGDPSEEDGNISLKLQEKGAAIGIVPGTKNITLLRALDREEKSGPSNVYVNVRCDRRRTTDPSFIIPVSVRVWDVNDNAPQWAGAPYSVRLSELTAPGSRVLQAVKATDADQPGPHATIHYSVLPGPNSEYFEFANELDSILMVKKPLDYETMSSFNITLRAQDGGRPPLHNDTVLTVYVLDADDQNPKFGHEHYTAVLPDNAEVGTILETKPEAISAKDQDVGINAPLHYSATGDKKHLVAVDKDSGRVAVTELLLDHRDMPFTVVIKATQVDNSDRYALATLTVSRRAGSLRVEPNEAPGRAGGVGGVGDAGGGAAASDTLPVKFSARSYSAVVPEDAVPGTVLTTLRTKPSHTESESQLQFFVSERGFLDKFAINSLGELLLRRTLDYEAQQHYHYQVMVTDGHSNDTASINITVANVNEWEPRFRFPHYEFRLGDLKGTTGTLLPVGTVEVFDGDKGDKVSLSLRGPDAGMLHINDSGEVFMRQEAIATLNTSVLHAVATAVDSGNPPKQSSVPVLVHIPPELLVAPSSPRGAGVVGIFAGVLTLLALLVLVLLVYICRVRRRSKSSATSTSTKSNLVSRDKSTPLPPGPAPGTVPCAASLQSVSAGASTILDSSSSLDLPDQGNATNNATVGRQSQRYSAKSKIAPAPPSPRTHLSDHVSSLEGGAGAGRSGVAWPRGTIPARIKKLSWEDATHKGSGEGQAEETMEEARRTGAGGTVGMVGTAVHDATNPALQEHMNLTVYF